MRSKLINAITGIILLSSLFLISYKKKINTCEAILKEKKIYSVYNKPSKSSSITYYLDNDSINENYYVVEIYKIKDDWAQISAYSPMKTYKNKGWIELVNLGIFPSSELILFKLPNEKTEKIKIANYDYRILDILDCKNKWLKVSYSDSLRKYEGWLPPYNQCANPYTTCN